MKGILLIIYLMGFSACFDGEPIDAKLEKEKLPAIRVLLMDSITMLDISKLPIGKPLVLFYFSPDCPHCRAQTESIIQDIKSLTDIQFCILTPASFSAVREFYEKYQLEKYQNIVVGLDQTAAVVNHFKIRTVPYFAIYDKKRRLRRIVNGKIDPYEIKEIVQG